MSGLTQLVVFLDRDGILNELVLDAGSGLYESPYRPEDVTVPDEALRAVALLRSVGAKLVVVSNQPSAAKGTTTLDDLSAVDRAVREAFSARGLAFDLVLYCHHHPDGVNALGKVCVCRKPSPGLLERAQDELGLPSDSATWLIGDSDVDIEAGAAVGATTILVDEPRSAHRRSERAEPDYRARSVLSAAEIVVAQSGR